MSDFSKNLQTTQAAGADDRTIASGPHTKGHQVKINEAFDCAEVVSFNVMLENYRWNDANADQTDKQKWTIIGDNLMDLLVFPNEAGLTQENSVWLLLSDNVVIHRDTVCWMRLDALSFDTIWRGQPLFTLSIGLSEHYFSMLARRITGEEKPDDDMLEIGGTGSGPVRLSEPWFPAITEMVYGKSPVYSEHEEFRIPEPKGSWEWEREWEDLVDCGVIENDAGDGTGSPKASDPDRR